MLFKNKQTNQPSKQVIGSSAGLEIQKNKLKQYISKPKIQDYDTFHEKNWTDQRWDL